MIRRRFFDEMKAIAAGGEAKGTIRDPAKNVRVQLPIADREHVLVASTTAKILADPRKKLLFTTYPFQAGQPDEVKRQFEDAMGIEVGEVGEFGGLAAAARGA